MFGGLRRALSDWWRHLQTIHQMAVVGAVGCLVSALATIATPIGTDSDSLAVLVGAAYFLFGVFVAFALDRARGRMEKVNDLLKTDEANLLALFQMSAILGPQVQAEMRSRIDALLQDQIDYFLSDFHRSAASHQALLNYVVDSSSREELGAPIVREQLLTTMLAINASRTQVEAATTHSMSPAEWVCILVLFGVLFMALPVFSSGVALGTLVVALLCGVLAVFVAILWSVDHLQWQEETWIWKPLHRLFSNLGLEPYYPADVLAERRAIPEPGRIRVASYPNRYPDMTGKPVSLREWP